MGGWWGWAGQERPLVVTYSKVPRVWALPPVVLGGLGRHVLPSWVCCLKASHPALTSPRSTRLLLQSQWTCDLGASAALLPAGILVQNESGGGGSLTLRAVLRGNSLGSAPYRSVPATLDPAAKTSQACQEQPSLGPAGPQLQELSGSCSQPGVLMLLRMKQKED